MQTSALVKKCTRCQRTFSCAGCSSGQCWCMDYPPILSCAADSDCMCEPCLTSVTLSHINTHIDIVQAHSHRPELAAKCVNLPLIEGLDYIINPEGRWVLSRWYLLKRGTCCGNNCTHCPFGYVNVAKP